MIEKIRYDRVATSSHAIVENSKEDEENIKGRENNEEVVERVSHLICGQNKNDENIANNTKGANTSLK